MMRDNDYNLLIQKADELRSLFVLGQKVIPFLEDIFQFLKETQPMFEEINESINENLQKMPSASQQLSKVTQESEKTTNQIMDEVDSIINNAISISKSDISGASSNSPIKILRLLKDAIADGKDLRPTLPMLEKAISLLEKDSGDGNIKELADNINTSANAIMMSLQIQDITSQQLASVDHMLKNLQSKMQEMLNKFKNEDIADLKAEDTYSERTNVTKLHRDIAFDPDAVDNYDEDSDKQSDVDAIFSGEYNLEDEDIQEDSEDNTLNSILEEEDHFESLDIESDNDTDMFESRENDLDDTDIELSGFDEDLSDQQMEDNDIFSELTDNDEISETDDNISTDDLDSLESLSLDDIEINEDDTKISADNDDNISEDEDDGDTQFSQDDIDAMFGG